jgi:holo-[acyl-carrier protein] synthase
MSFFSASLSFCEILGIGVDLVDSRRIAGALAKYGSRFETRIFTPQERLQAEQQQNPVLFYAKRFAAKEAFVKATTLGIGKSISWQDINVVSGPRGAPEISLSQRCEHVLLAQWHTPFCIKVSLSDEKPYAQAFVVIARYRPDDQTPVDRVQQLPYI